MVAGISQISLIQIMRNSLVYVLRSPPLDVIKMTASHRSFSAPCCVRQSALTEYNSGGPFYCGLRFPILVTSDTENMQINVFLKYILFFFYVSCRLH